MSWKTIILENHCGYNRTGLSDYATLLKNSPLNDDDLKYFEYVITHAAESQSGYDTFPDAGGIDIAAILLAEVRRLK